MAKRELSSTLKNLKFMQRAVQKEEKTKIEQEVKVDDGNFISSTTQKRKCVVIMEGSPHPAIKGRMSFQNFNPTIDKLNEEPENLDQEEVPNTISGDPNERKISNREKGFSQMRPEESNISRSDNDSPVDLKRKQPEIDPETQSSSKPQRNVSGIDQSSPDNRKASRNNKKREKLDWSVLRPPPKGQT
ncbi:scarecrow-like transcription factor 11 (SCL11) [Tasmannia lanceolata]|uniref:scarecrow-like transcription factor 11 (SCL11) n=1 Tax=Tasmannia lanceolata TaxID=3420 RepID=UPI004064A746